jgi:hypothetical protein
LAGFIELLVLECDKLLQVPMLLPHVDGRVNETELLMYHSVDGLVDEVEGSGIHHQTCKCIVAEALPTKR